MWLLGARVHATLICAYATTLVLNMHIHFVGRAAAHHRCCVDADADTAHSAKPPKECKHMRPTAGARARTKLHGRFARRIRPRCRRTTAAISKRQDSLPAKANENLWLLATPDDKDDVDDDYDATFACVCLCTCLCTASKAVYT